MQQPLDLTQILATLRRLLPTLAHRYHVQSLGVFGSYVRHTQRPGSDLDVLVTFEEPPGLLTFLALENYLSDVLGVKVDLVMREALKPAIGEHVLRIWCRYERRADLYRRFGRYPRCHRHDRAVHPRHDV